MCLSLAALSPQYNLSFQKLYQLVYALIEFQLAIFPPAILNSDSLQWCTKLRFVLQTTFVLHLNTIQTTFVLHLNTTMIRRKLNKASRQIFCLNRFIRIQFRFLSVMNTHFMLHILRVVRFFIVSGYGPIPYHLLLIDSFIGSFPYPIVSMSLVVGNFPWKILFLYHRNQYFFCSFLDF